LRPWLTWTELTDTPRDTPGKRQELVALIRQYPRENILRACATLSALFNFGPEGNTTADDGLTIVWIPKLFHPDLVEKVKAYAADKRVIFFQAQLRFLASEVIRVEPDPTKLVAPVLPKRHHRKNVASIGRDALSAIYQTARSHGRACEQGRSVPAILRNRFTA
jgi:hypothetical protein